MGVIIRGAKNAFRNTVRTLSVTLILALSIGLALIMLLSYQTVQTKIKNVQSSIGNTITVTPAGAQGFEGGGEPLTADQATAVKTLAHVSSVKETVSDRLTPTTDTSLASAIDAGTLGQRFGRGGSAAESGTTSGNTGSSSSTPERTFTIPITVTGVSDAASITSESTKITSGAVFDATKDADVAVVGSDLATKNSLTVGSTFTAYSGTTIKVVGIFDSGNKFGNSGLYMPLSTVQRLSDQAGQVSTITVTADAITNVDSVVTAIQNKLGSDKADVTSNKSAADQALSPLENIKNISFYSLVGSLVAGAVITLLTMIMIVRERRREIGVLKAIGSSNLGVMTQFVAESLVLTLLGSVLGVAVGIAFSNPVLNALVTNSTATTQSTTAGAGGGFRQIARLGGEFGGGIQNTLQNIHTSVGISIILYGLLAAVLIAILGSAVPAWLIAKVKPAEVMRGE